MRKLLTVPKSSWFPTVFWLLLVSGLSKVLGKSDPGKTDIFFTPGSNIANEERPLLANSKLYAKLLCESREPTKVSIYWTLTERDCWYDIPIYHSSSKFGSLRQENQTVGKIIASAKMIADCPTHLTVFPASSTSYGNASVIGSSSAQLQANVNEVTMKRLKKSSNPLMPAFPPIVTIPQDGIYELVITFEVEKASVYYSGHVHIDVVGPYGYISATDWPLLPFFGIMCIVYVIFGIIWLVVSFMQWRDLLRIQFWIGGVIFLGMLEKAFFYAQYHNLNVTGVPVQKAELTAEFVSCAKRTLARMLVIIMSLGFGIVKPRLGSLMHRVVGVGTLYLALACVESYLRVVRTKSDERNELLVASIPLAVLDTGICWWIFTSLVQTTRTLRLRRNVVKLSLYRHFTNTLIFSVVASVIFMIFALRFRKSESCTPGWRYIWIDAGFWHILFSVLLLVIMILWRPTNNNQRYSFTPLLDNPEDEDDEEEEDKFIADAYGVKMRGSHANGYKTPPSLPRERDDDLRWVEENIPSFMADSTLPVLDTDDEIINTKFEVSKMQ